MARTDPQINFRIPEELKQRLDESAAASGKSLTAEIVHRLQAFDDMAQLVRDAKSASDMARDAYSGSLQFVRLLALFVAEVVHRTKGMPLDADSRRHMEDMRKLAASIVEGQGSPSDHFKSLVDYGVELGIVEITGKGSRAVASAESPRTSPGTPAKKKAAKKR